MSRRRFLRVLTVWALLLPSVAIQAAEEAPSAPSDAEKAAFFTDRVEPILKNHCAKCHGAEGKIRGGLRLDSREAVLKGGDLGPTVELDAPEESLLLEALRYEGLEMPPSGRLPDEDVQTIVRWIEMGLPWAGGEAPAPLAETGEESDSIAHADDWPFDAIVRPPVPAVKESGWVRGPIDAFVLSKLEAEGLAPAPEADRRTLIRRLSYDLTGLPPSPEEVEAFVGDQSTDAYERLVDRLLASPHYGEAWGRHWLDLVGYGETNGYERDSAKPFVWRYRDYVIAAFNEDKPYDQFIHEQLAGDEIAPDSLEAQIATGYYRLGLWDDEPADRPQARYDTLDGIVSTTGQVFLGMTIGCARCHDHKRDPIPQTDYYRLLAFFIDMGDQTGLEVHPIGDDGVKVLSVREKGRAEPHVLLRGNPYLVGPKVEPGVPEAIDTDGTTFTGEPGKRRALAEWLTDRRNPMTARVFANRLWQYHFGRGIVPTPNDFGALGEPATHPELLDWLAAELMDGGWTVKRMHRMILLSSAYRMSSRASAEGLARDPANQWFWRFPMRRLTAEEVRDAILSASGELNMKAGGPGVRPPIPAEVLAGQSVPGQGWDVSPPDEAARRSVYVHVKRSLLVPILATHDAADTDSSCPVRYTTTVPTQALGLLNGSFSNEQAALFARRLEAECSGDLTDRIRRAIILTTNREPRPDELARDVAFTRSLQTEAGLSARDALAQYCLLALNANEFLYLD